MIDYNFKKAFSYIYKFVDLYKNGNRTQRLDIHVSGLFLYTDQ